MENDNKEKQEIEQNQNKDVVEINNNENHEEVIEEKTETIAQEANVKKEVIESRNDIQESSEEKVENIIEQEKNIKIENNLEIDHKEDTEDATKIEINLEIESEETDKNKTKFIKLLLLIIPLVLVILVLIYLFTDLFKTDEQNFAKYMYITSKNIENLKSEEVEKYFAKTKYTSNGSISANSYGEELSIEFDGKTDIENRLKETNITTDYSGEELEINYKQDNDTYAIKINDIYDKYIAIQNNNLKELANSLGLDSDNIPDEINLEKYKFTEDELEDIKQRYIEIIKNEIIKKNYSREKDNEYTIYKLTLTNKQLNNIKIKILQELKNDNLILNKYVIYEELNGNKIEKEDLENEIDENIKELEANAFEQDKEALVISLYTKLNKCKKIEIKLTEEIIVIEMYSSSLKLTSERENNDFSFKIQKEEIAQELKYNIQIEDEKFDFDINLKYSDLSKDTLKEEYDVDLNFDKDNIKLRYTNTILQNEKLIVNHLENSECEILNNLNKNEINELIYKIYNNMISL